MTSSSSRGPIIVDAMGGDLGAAEMVRAVSLLRKEEVNVGEVILVGKERLLKELLKKADLDTAQNIRVHNATQVIGMDEKPIQSLKEKKDSSMVRAIELLKDGTGKAVVSCGNTGSLMAAGTLKLRQMTGVERPALATIMPTPEKPFILIDAGANPAAKPEHLVHNAVLGVNYAKVALKVARPRVGLLSIGTEETKGVELTIRANQLLKEVSASGIIDYRGPIEGFQVFANEVDVIVCDGFTGNILLKTCEGLFSMLVKYTKSEIKKTPLRMAGALLSQGAFKAIKSQLSPEKFGGAPLMGLKGTILKSHGSSNQHFIMNAIRMAAEVVANDMQEHILEDITKTNEILAKVKQPAAVAGNGE